MALPGVGSKGFRFLGLQHSGISALFIGHGSDDVSSMAWSSSMKALNPRSRMGALLEIETNMALMMYPPWQAL